MFLKLGNKIANVFKSSSGKLDDDLLFQIEENLILSDISYDVVGLILHQIKKQYFDKEVSLSDVNIVIKGIIKKYLSDINLSVDCIDKSKSVPNYTILFTGINGGGKTTSVGKIAKLFKNDNRKVLLCAGDTFRTAATEQLDVWSKKVGVDILTGENKEPAALIYDSYKKSVDDSYDVLLIDTAGRLQSRSDLMGELEKIVRVLSKQNENAISDSLLVLDASIGQNMISQAAAFIDCAKVSGFIITKLDGAAKAGALITLIKTFKLPVFFIGNGEGDDNISMFNIDDYLDNILGLE